jgi:hypothetical protein
MKKFYTVLGLAGLKQFTPTTQIINKSTASTVLYSSQKEAMAEAERLCVLEPHKQFVVLEAKTLFKPKVESIDLTIEGE